MSCSCISANMSDRPISIVSSKRSRANRSRLTHSVSCPFLRRSSEAFLRVRVPARIVDIREGNAAGRGRQIRQHARWFVQMSTWSQFPEVIDHRSEAAERRCTGVSAM